MPATVAVKPTLPKNRPSNGALPMSPPTKEHEDNSAAEPYRMSRRARQSGGGRWRRRSDADQDDSDQTCGKIGLQQQGQAERRSANEPTHGRARAQAAAARPASGVVTIEGRNIKYTRPGVIGRS